MEVFVVEHVHKLHEDGDDVKLFGVYSTEESAQAAVKRFSTQAGFREPPDGFDIDRYRVDQDNWTEGFISSVAALER